MSIGFYMYIHVAHSKVNEIMYYKNRVIATNSWRNNDPRGKDKAKQKISPHAHTTQKQREDWRQPMWCESTNQSQGCSNFKLQSLLSSSAQEEEQDSRGQPHYRAYITRNYSQLHKGKLTRWVIFSWNWCHSSSPSVQHWAHYQQRKTSSVAPRQQQDAKL